ncbi:MAG: hypothetical protein ACKO6D_00215 [Rubrivivax sp.]
MELVQIEDRFFVLHARCLPQPSPSHALAPSDARRKQDDPMHMNSFTTQEAAASLTRLLD